MAPGVLEQIFEPFFTTKGVGKGAGLGLSQMFGFAKQSGGDVLVESIEGQGATFTLYLPRAEPPAFDQAPSKVEEAPDVRGRILIVEDNVEVGEFARQILNDLGFETTLVASAQAALPILKTQADRFDFVFSDVVMPGISGLELGRRIRARWPRLPVVTSGYSQVLAEDAHHGFPILQKPYSVSELGRVLRSVRR